MVHSSGLAIIYKKRILLVHPKNSRWEKTYSIPKGHVEPGETALEAAIRETEEEVGISVPVSLIDKTEREIFYYKKEKPWKKISYFVVRIDDLNKIGLESETVPKGQLQASEVDWAGFVSFIDVEKRILPPMMDIIKNIG